MRAPTTPPPPTRCWRWSTDLDDERRAALSIDLGADPLTAPLSGRAGAVDRRGRRRPPARPSATTAACGPSPSTARHSTISAPARRGSWPVRIAAGVSYLRVLDRGGVSAPDALRQISFRFAADDDQFMTIAKLRAARQLWARVAEVVGAPDAGAATVHAVTSLPMMAQRDPWVNMLRTTLAAFARRRRAAPTPSWSTRSTCAIPGGCARYRSEFRAPHRPQHPAAAAGGVAHRPGARSRRRLVVRRGPHRGAGRAGVGALPATSKPAAGSPRRPTIVADADRGGGEQRRRRHRPPAHGSHRRQRVPEPRGSAAAAS